MSHRGPVTAVFCTPHQGRSQRVLAVAQGLVQAGARVYVFAPAQARAHVVRLGGEFVDFYERFPVESADSVSWPVPVRFVTHAATFLRQALLELESRGVQLIVYDTFAVIGWAAGRVLGIPYVNSCAGHNQQPAHRLEELQADPRLAPAEVCWNAVQVLKQEFGISDASPLSFVATQSPYLNLYGEPKQFLAPEQRAAFAPVAFLGALNPELQEEGPRRPHFRGSGPRVFVSFGTVIWKYYRAEALDALAAIAEAFVSEPACEVLMTLGGAEGSDALPRLSHPNVFVHTFVDQWAVLQETDIFVTHHGLSSTHEAIYHRVPMLSYPFFSDQPALARRCHELGLAEPLGRAPRAAITVREVRAAFAQVQAQRPRMLAQLEQARAWELETLRDRPQIFEQIMSLSRSPA